MGSISKVEVTAGSPASTAPSFAVVPPMSKVTTCGSPASVPTSALISTPAAGPDSTIRAGSSAAMAGETSPPAECMMNMSFSKPRSASAVSSRSM